MNELTQEQLELNQKCIDLIDAFLDEECDNSKNYFNFVDSKSLLKWLWNNGYKFTKRSI